MKKLLQKGGLFLAIVSVVLSGCRKSDFVIDSDDVTIEDNGEGTGTVTWESGKEYILEGKVFVNDGQVLTIEAGTVIRAKQGSGSSASALIVARGGRIIAEGTAANPIIFTCEGDDLEGSIDYDDRGLWGGVIILGMATINTSSGEDNIEGISTSEPRGIFGGSNDEDNSGVLKYVSIRHGGTDLGQDNEINGLTFGGVGSETVIENIEVISNADDGIEIFGGTVNLKNIVVTHCSDDAIDIDLGYRGNAQFLCLIQNDEYGDNLLEIDGGDDVKTAMPYSTPIIYNVTGVGRNSEYSNKLITFNDNAGGRIYNSVFINQGNGVTIEYSASRKSSYQMWEQGYLVLENNIFYDVNSNESTNLFSIVANDDEDIAEQQGVIDEYFITAPNRIANPEFEQTDSTITLISESPELTSSYSALPDDSFFSTANYVGAFGTYNWISDWTLTCQEGIVY